MLRNVADDGTVRTVQGEVFHTADADPDRLENNLNPGGAERVVSGADATSGALLLGFEVPPASLADLDGTNGFRLDGIDADDQGGSSVLLTHKFWFSANEPLGAIAVGPSRP